MSFCVVLFINSNEVEVVPTCWITDDTCLWPSYSDAARVRKAIKNLEHPSDDWNSYSVKIYKILYSYSRAISFCKKAEDGSDMQSDHKGEGRGFRRKIVRRMSSSSDDTLPFHPSPPPARRTHTHVSIDAPVVSTPPLLRQNANFKKKQSCPPSSSNSQTIQEEAAPTCNNCSGIPLELVNNLIDGNETILHAVTRIEIATSENTTVLRNVTDDLKNISSFLNKERSDSTTVDFTAINETCPVQTIEEFYDAKMKLSHETGFKELFICRITCIGGISLAGTVKNMMDFLMLNDVQKRFNWQGKNPFSSSHPLKRGFQNTYIARLVKDCILGSRSETTDIEIGKAIMQYLRNAGDRCGGRRKRFRVRQPGNDGQENDEQAQSIEEH